MKLYKAMLKVVKNPKRGLTYYLFVITGLWNCPHKMEKPVLKASSFYFVGNERKDFLSSFGFLTSTHLVGFRGVSLPTGKPKLYPPDFTKKELTTWTKTSHPTINQQSTIIISYQPSAITPFVFRYTSPRMGRSGGLAGRWSRRWKSVAWSIFAPCGSPPKKKRCRKFFGNFALCFERKGTNPRN